MQASGFIATSSLIGTLTFFTNCTVCFLTILTLLIKCVRKKGPKNVDENKKAITTKNTAKAASTEPTDGKLKIGPIADEKKSNKGSHQVEPNNKKPNEVATPKSKRSIKELEKPPLVKNNSAEKISNDNTLKEVPSRMPECDYPVNPKEQIFTNSQLL